MKRRPMHRPKGRKFVDQLNDMKSAKQSVHTWEGFNLATMMMVVAINNKFGFGKKRFKIIEEEMNRIWSEEFRKDMESASVGLTKRCVQILGDDFEHYYITED